MKFSKSLLQFTILVSVATILATGCNRKSRAPKNDQGDRVKVVTLSQDRPEELEHVTSLETARVNYRYRVQVLQAYYENVGNMDKFLWTEREMKNLDTTMTFAWAGLPEIMPPKGETVVEVDEQVLVEYVVAARTKYTTTAETLRAFYGDSDETFIASLIANMQDRLDPIYVYMYFLSAEIPPADLKPTAVIPEADLEYKAALKLHKQGKGLLRMAMTTDYDKQRLALVKFRNVVEKYPTSNKIPLTAYYIGEIYKEYFNENIRAVGWYQRAWQWDPNIEKPARFQAAVVQDLRLHDYGKAVELYREVIRHEQFNASHVSHAHNRIGELTGRK